MYYHGPKCNINMWMNKTKFRTLDGLQFGGKSNKDFQEANFIFFFFRLKIFWWTILHFDRKIVYCGSILFTNMRYDQAKQYLARSCDIFASTSTLCQRFPEYFGLGPFAIPELNKDCRWPATVFLLQHQIPSSFQPKYKYKYKWPTVFLFQHQIPSIFQPKYKFNTNWCKHRHKFRCIFYHFAMMKDIVSLKRNVKNKKVKYT